jgi:hypothetical protein
LQKTFIYFFNIQNLFSRLPKIKGPIQVLGSALEKHNYINLAFETDANNSEEIMYPKKLLFSPIHLLVVLFIWRTLIFA